MEQFSTTYLAEYLQMLREIIEEGQREGLFRKGINSKLVAKLLFGLLDEMATNWVLSHGNHSLTAMAGPVLDIFFHGVTASHA
jgi:TetR/AcrR family fatty acid metabolism transcriptional regulator